MVYAPDQELILPFLPYTRLPVDDLPVEAGYILAPSLQTLRLELDLCRDLVPPHHHLQLALPCPGGGEELGLCHPVVLVLVGAGGRGGSVWVEEAGEFTFGVCLQHN